MPQATRVVAAGVLAILLAGGFGAAGQKGGKQPRAAATAASEKGTLLERWPTDKPWKVAAAREKLNGGTPLLALPGTAASVEAGKVRLDLVGNLPGVYPTSALESAVTLHETKGVDLDFTLERGRVLVAHAGTKGTTARARVRFGKESWVLNLAEPGTRVLVSVKLHRLPWTEFPKKPDPKLKPLAEIDLLVMSGSADLEEAAGRQTLGPLSWYRWTSETGADAVTVLKEAPADVKPANDANAKKIRAAVRDVQGRLAKGAPATVLKAALQDKDAQVRAVAVYGLGAIGDIDAVSRSLADPKHPEARLAAVRELRHWVGQSYDDDQRLFDLLVLQKYSKPHAEMVVKLLHNFTPAQLAQPETYEALIHYLTHDRLAIRQLAVWHLTRLVPDGGKIAYDPAGTPEQLRQGQALWRKRVPEGKLPSAPGK